MKFTQSQWLAIAALARDFFGQGWTKEERNVIIQMLLEYAQMFKDDNPRFDPVTFLDLCSPDTDRYPLSELWEG